MLALNEKSVSHLVNSVLVEDTKRLASQERRLAARILVHLEEIDRRKLYLEYGCVSLVKFCVKVLGYSEGSAYRRPQSARLIRSMPETLPLLESGQLTLTNAAKANEFFKAEGIKDQEKKTDVVSQLLGKTGREAELLLKEKSSPGSTFRRKSLLRRATATDWDLSVTLSNELKEKLERIRDIKSHSAKSWEDVLNIMADITLKELTKVRKPRDIATASRTPTPAMRQEKMQEAGFRCQHPGCKATAFLQVDHIIPVSRGGRTEMANLQVLCAAHNARKR